MLRHQVTHDTMAGFMIGGVRPLFLRHHHGFTLSAHHDLVFSLLKMPHRNQALILTRREKCRLIHHVCQIGAGEARCPPRNIHRDHIF